jgi:hypothetical protein
MPALVGNARMYAVTPAGYRVPALHRDHEIVWSGRALSPQFRTTSGKNNQTFVHPGII